MTELDTAANESEAVHEGEQPHVIRGITTAEDAYDAFAEALSFPDYFGRNLDALFDCLIDLSWLPEGKHVLVWINSDLLRGNDIYTGIHSVLIDAVAWYAQNTDHRVQLRIVLVDS